MAANKSKKIEVNSSSIVDLKAELFRKQEEVRLKKNVADLEKTLKPSSNLDEFIAETTDDHLYERSSHNISRLPKKFISFSSVDEKKIPKMGKKTELHSESCKNELSQKEELALEKSRTMLEKKAKLYDQMASGSVLPDNDNDDLLVNFDQKLADNYRTSYNHYEDDEELVEYEDEFGRTRLVKRKDLPRNEFVKNDNKLEENSEWTLENHLLSDDMKNEIERRAWEENSRSELENNKSEIHYEDVREGEIRDHGVAFFNFSAEEDTRAKQMEMLEQMRQETESKKSEKQRIKEKRKQMLKERLSKVAARKGIAIVDEESDKSDSEPEEKIVIEKAKIKADKNFLKVHKLRDWDVGKEGLYSSKSSANTKTPLYSQEKFVENRRTERNTEFAPPSSYSEHRSTFRSGQNKRFKPQVEHSDDQSHLKRDEYHSNINNNSDANIAAFVGDQISQIRRNLANGT